MHLTPIGIAPFDYDCLPTTTAQQLRQAAIDIHEAQSTAMSAIAEIGNRLITAKNLLSHGHFASWLDAELRLTVRTAENYMSAARFLDGKAKCISHLPAHIVYKLASPSTAPEIIDAVVAAAEAGAPLAVKEIAGRIDAVQRARHENRHENQEIERATIETRSGRSRRRKLTREQAIEELARERVVREREKAERQSRLAPLAEQVIRALGDELVHQVLETLDSWDDRATFVALLRLTR